MASYIPPFAIERAKDGAPGRWGLHRRDTGFFAALIMTGGGGHTGEIRGFFAALRMTGGLGELGEEGVYEGVGVEDEEVFHFFAYAGVEDGEA